MFVYDFMYGTDMADALFQTVNAGYSGSVVWMLDDAMHAKEAPDKLKVWGFGISLAKSISVRKKRKCVPGFMPGRC